MMLVLTRKKTETIRIGEDIVVTVVQTGSGRVKLGIEAPVNVRVLRGELDFIDPAKPDLLGANFRRNVGRPWELVHEFGNTSNN
jgi:carbon storage regulator